MKVLLVDSGIGGFSIYQQIKMSMPWLNVDYLMDNAFLPYGNKSEEALVQRLTLLIGTLLETNAYDFCVLACNTASTAALESLRQEFSLPFIGVVPAIKPAGESTLNKHIALLATPATCESPYVANLCNDFALECQVDHIGTVELVAYIEEWLLTQKHSAKLKDILMPAINSRADTLVLGCTHFPLIKDELQALMPEKRLLDSGEAIARRLKDLSQDVQIKKEGEGRLGLYYTKAMPSAWMSAISRQFDTDYSSCLSSSSSPVC